MRFKVISGLKINLNKSELLPISRVENVEVLALELGCKVVVLPSSHLGLSLGAPVKSTIAWDGMEERFRKRLAMWKRQYISKRERITQIQSTLGSMPIYFMSLLTIPRSVRLRLEQIQTPLGWEGSCVEALLSKLRDCLLGEEEEWFGC